MKGESEATIEEARATIRKFAHLTTHSRELVSQSAALLARSNTLCSLAPETALLKSLKIDLKVGLTFAAIAAYRPNERQRNQRNARIAYDTVVRQLERIHLSSSDKSDFQPRVEKLRTALKQLGEKV